MGLFDAPHGQDQANFWGESPTEVRPRSVIVAVVLVWLWLFIGVSVNVLALFGEDYGYIDPASEKQTLSSAIFALSVVGMGLLFYGSLQALARKSQTLVTVMPIVLLLFSWIQLGLTDSANRGIGGSVLVSVIIVSCVNTGRAKLWFATNDTHLRALRRQ
ncbi:hypothetical protein EH165_07740 [Nakamurella antarctica]|uniref:Uncharacterized protein n=1 Tax=Nakamurella antarctica TaxID=1902245 RepID=A0A3G8ZWI3_9ACTN|nr:hypothetical protein [Nakamurella antarctica]AZI58051.1 hypothetical protein EH165_07740 [Nakamurella antarctica]